jgi:hypothetical protein
MPPAANTKAALELVEGTLSAQFTDPATGRQVLLQAGQTFACGARSARALLSLPFLQTQAKKKPTQAPA